MARLARTRRSRRGVEAIEFAMILPVFIALIFAIIEFSWYMFQRNAMVDIARRSCQQAASLDPDLDDFATFASLLIIEELREEDRGAGIDCDDSDRVCTVIVDDLSDEDPPRIVCDIDVNYVSLSGFLPASDGMKMGQRRWSSAGVLPSTIHGRGVAIFEEAD